MDPIVVEAEINAPPARVFALAADIPNVPKYQPAITRIEMLTDGAVGVGTRWKETRKVMGREATIELKIVEFVPDQSYTVEAFAGGARYVTRLAFDALGAGTRASMRVTIEPKGLLGSAMAWLSRGAMRSGLSDDLRTLKAASEAARA